MKTRLVLLFLVSWSIARAGGPPMIEPPLPQWLERESWTLDVSGSFLTKVISPDTNFKYRLTPFLLTLKTPGFYHRSLAGGTFSIRHSATLLAESIYGGPETHYFGLALRPSLEWWRSDGRFFVYFSPGGGAGVIDSRGIEGGQGQDFTLNILAGAGVGWKTADRFALRAGLLFQHLSNGGQTDQNPGLNALGPELGFSVSF